LDEGAPGVLSILGEFFYFAPLFRPAWEEGWTRERLES